MSDVAILYHQQMRPDREALSHLVTGSIEVDSQNYKPPYCCFCKLVEEYKFQWLYMNSIWYRKKKVIGNDLDAVIQIISLAIVQNHPATKIKRPSLKVLGAIAKMTPRTKLTMKLVSWLNRQMRSSAEIAPDGSTIKAHESTIPGFVDPSSGEKAAEHVFIPLMSSRLDFVITRKKLIHNKIEESKKPSLKPSLKSGLGEWIKDSGCSKHMTGNKSLFSTYKAYDRGKTPYEIFRGRKTSLEYFKVFGSKCFILNTKDYLTKFDPKSYEGVFLGYSQNSKAYVVLNKHTMKVEESLNVTFDESPPPTKLSPLVDDDVGEKEAIESNIKVVNNSNKEDESIEVDEVVNIKEFKDHPLEQVIGDLNFFLGLKIKQMKDGIIFNQSKYIKEMLKKFGLEDSKPTKTPISTEIKLTKDDEADSVDSYKYRGEIMPQINQKDYQLTKAYLPRIHRSDAMNKEVRESYRRLESRLFHEVIFVTSSFIKANNMLLTFQAVGLKPFLTLDEPICPRFVTEFYHSLEVKRVEEKCPYIEFKLG
nr:retrovirus-related Pol polyprotein from transposon TNT 1-94 [Tanacetum cinerariifolium]